MKPLLLACTLAVAISAIADEKPNSTEVTGTVLTPKTVKDYSGLTLELRLYEHHPFIADKPADLVAKLTLKDYAHKEGKETKTKITIGEAGKIMPGMSYYITCMSSTPKPSAISWGKRMANAACARCLPEATPTR